MLSTHRSSCDAVFRKWGAFYFLFCVGLFLTPLSSQAQETQFKNDLPNLWIITIDESGSMIPPNGRSWTSAFRKRMVNFVNQEFRDSLFSQTQADPTKDQFLFYNSGIVVKDSANKIDPDNECCIERFQVCLDWIDDSTTWPYAYIHPYPGTSHIPEQFPSAKAFEQKVSKLISQGRFSYQFSFVALIRMFSLVRMLEDIDQELFPYNRVYVVVISDFKDHNDQWNMDYKYLDLCTSEKFQESNAYFNRYETNRFNKDSRQLGTFQALYTTKKPSRKQNEWNIHLYEYVTAQGLEQTLEQAFPNTLTFEKDTVLHLSFPERFQHDSIEFVNIDSIWLGNQLLASDFAVTATWTMPLSLPRTADSLSFRWKGHAQLIYQDSLLSKRRRIIQITEQSQQLASPFVPFQFTAWHIIGLVCAGLGIIAVLVYFLYLKGGIITIQDAAGNSYIIQRGYLLYRGNHSILHVSLNGLNSIFVKRRFLTFRQEEAQGLPDYLYISSKKELTIYGDDEIKIEPITRENTIDQLYQYDEIEDSFIQQWDNEKGHLYRVSIEAKPSKRMYKLSMNEGRKTTSFDVTIDQLTSENLPPVTDIEGMLSAHVASQRAAKSLLYIDDSEEKLRWHVILLDGLNQSIQDVNWVIDFTQILPDDMTEEDKVNLIHHQAKELKKSLGLTGCQVYYQGDSATKFPSFQAPSQRSSFRIKKSYFPAFLHLVEDIIIDDPQQLVDAKQVAMHVPLHKGQLGKDTYINGKYVSIEEAGNYRLYSSLFPSIQESLAFADCLQKLDQQTTRKRIFRIAGPQQGHLQFSTDTHFPNIDIHFLDQSAITTQFKASWHIFYLFTSTNAVITGSSLRTSKMKIPSPAMNL